MAITPPTPPTPPSPPKITLGDAARDVMAAKQAGVRGVRYVGGSLADCVREALAS